MISCVHAYGVNVEERGECRQRKTAITTPETARSDTTRLSSARRPAGSCPPICTGSVAWPAPYQLALFQIGKAQKDEDTRMMIMKGGTWWSDHA